MRLAPAVEVRLLAERPDGQPLTLVHHNPATFAALLARTVPGAWTNLWPGVADEQVFGRCSECGAPGAMPLIVQARYTRRGALP